MSPMASAHVLDQLVAAVCLLRKDGRPHPVHSAKATMNPADMLRLIEKFDGTKTAIPFEVSRDGIGALVPITFKF